MHRCTWYRDDFLQRPSGHASTPSRFIEVNGIRTHYLEAGDRPPLVLLHSGEFGGSAELCWEYLIPASGQLPPIRAPK